MASSVPGPVKGVMASVAVAPASGRTTIWKGSLSFFAAKRAMASPAAVGGAASRRTLSMVVVVQRVAPAGEGRAKVMSPVGVQSVHGGRAPPEPPEPPPPSPSSPHAARPEAAARVREQAKRRACRKGHLQRKIEATAIGRGQGERGRGGGSGFPRARGG
ncbi:MAG: hypothetical protein IT372_25565 [Polyangiaceae bacterium]|nr:hypothetical protein [Polyangiaceae bacterium]